MWSIMFLALAPVVSSNLWTAHDPFVGKWKLDVSRSTIVDGMRVQAVGPNTYAFNFEGGPTETIVADGTDQPGIPGTTLAVKASDGHNLTVIRKQGGQIIVSAAWKLSSDGRVLHDAFTSIQPDGPKMTVDYVYERTSAGSGFAGGWESTTKPVGLKLELDIEPYKERGFAFGSGGSEKGVTFDGHDHAVPGTTDGVSLSGRRLGSHAMEYTEKHQGKVERVRQFKLSRDGRTLTETVRIAGQHIPNVLVFDLE